MEFEINESWANKISINESWAKSIPFKTFCKDSNISKLKPQEQKRLYEEINGKKIESKIKEGEK